MMAFSMAVLLVDVPFDGAGAQQRAAADGVAALGHDPLAGRDAAHQRRAVPGGPRPGPPGGRSSRRRAGRRPPRPRCRRRATRRGSRSRRAPGQQHLGLDAAPEAQQVDAPPHLQDHGHRAGARLDLRSAGDEAEVLARDRRRAPPRPTAAPRGPPEPGTRAAAWSGWSASSIQTGEVRTTRPRGVPAATNWPGLTATSATRPAIGEAIRKLSGPPRSAAADRRGRGALAGGRPPGGPTGPSPAPPPPRPPAGSWPRPRAGPAAGASRAWAVPSSASSSVTSARSSARLWSADTRGVSTNSGVPRPTSRPG